MNPTTLAACTVLSLFAGAAPPRWWGFAGHEMGARAAAGALPADMPAFFRGATRQLAYLNGEPDRWRVREEPAMSEAFSYDHYLWLENVPAGALDAPDRFAFMDSLRAAGGPPHDLRNVGLLPYRMLELYKRLVTEWRLWRAERDASQRRFIEARIVNDAGILGHYAMDASNPHHASKHHNRWYAGDPNPEGYTADPAFHGQFERDFVETHVQQADITARVTGPPRSVVGNVRSAILDEIRGSHSGIQTLFRLQRDVGFSPARPASAETKAFAAERLAVGARMLRDLWWSAWLEGVTR